MGRFFTSFIRDNRGIIVALLLMVVVLSIISPVFLTSTNILNVLRQVSTNACLALGMTLVIILGGIDLSVGAVVALTGALTVGLMSGGTMSMVPAILVGLLVGLLCGVANGAIIAYTKMPPFIVTMAIMNIARGAAYVYTGGRPIRTRDPTFIEIGIGYLAGIPLPVIYTAVFIIIISLLLNRSVVGTHIYAVGGNREAARFSGIKIARIEILVYAISGLICAFAGVVLAARMTSGQPTVGIGFELDAIAACVLGGVSMSGGLGRVGGSMIGALVIGVINNGLNLMNVNSFWQLIAKGLVILIAVYVDMLKKQKEGRN
ncbi:MAG: ribose ABC transporter permease [Planctomycetes bacterium]|nr:ribose ABC transporter permease [Planctomycetota bacterium]